MHRPFTLIAKTLSVRLSLMVTTAIAVFILNALFVIFWYSQKVMKEEALQKGVQTLESSVLQIDNILLSVEQATGNIYWDLLLHLNRPELMFEYGRQMVKSNPYITGCAIAFEPNFYKGQHELFMAYVHRSDTGELLSSDSPIIQANTFGNVPYTEQIWYKEPVNSRRAIWFNPQKNTETDGDVIITFSLPIYQYDKVVGVFAVDLSLVLLSNIVSEAKPSPNSYAVLLGSDGSYIVHPDSAKLFHKKIQQAFSPELRDIASSMIAGETDYKPININNSQAYIFYKPFKRSAVPGRTMENLGWSIGLVYPEEDIFGEYKKLLYIVLLIAGSGLLLFFILCRVFTQRLLIPIRHLTASAQRIAGGDYETPIHDCQQDDEVGRLQEHFQEMQQALSAHVGELRQSTAALESQRHVLEDAYEQAKEADKMKTAFLHNMTNQMLKPVNAISSSVEILCDQHQKKSPILTEHLVNDIQQQGETITELLNQLLEVSHEDKSASNN